MGIVVAMALAMGLALGLARLTAGWTARSRRILAACLGGMVLELATVPLALPRVQPVDEAYRVLERTRPGPAAEFPFYYNRADFPRHTEYMLSATAHWKPLVNGYSDHIPANFRDSVLPLSTFPSMDAFRILRERRVRCVVLHVNRYDHRSRLRVEEGLRAYAAFLSPLLPTETVGLFEIVRWPPVD